jgi:hypothetical protein
LCLFKKRTTAAAIELFDENAGKCTLFCIYSKLKKVFVIWVFSRFEYDANHAIGFYAEKKETPFMNKV